jgi:hypothetical protein
MNPTIAAAPLVMRTTGWADYALLDSGHGKKLERYGRYTVVRPEPQCFWAPRLDAKVWDDADAVFDPSDEDEAGRWRFKGSRWRSSTWPGARRSSTASSRLSATWPSSPNRPPTGPGRISASAPSRTGSQRC